MHRSLRIARRAGTAFTLACLAAGFVAHASPLVAQGVAVPPLPVGARIRFTAPSLRPGRPVATIAAVGTDTLLLREPRRADAWPLPLAAITSLELSTGRHANKRRGFWRGAAAGAVGFAISSVVNFEPPHSCAILEENCEEISGPDSRTEAAVTGAIGGGLIGGAVGALVGAFWRTERWQSIPIGVRQSRIRIVPAPGGIRVGVTGS